MYNETYSLPTEITTEVRFFKFITIRSIIIMVLFLFLGTQLSNKVYEPLQIPFVIFNIVVGFLFCLNSRRNKQKRLYQSVLIMIFRDRHYYKPIPNPNKMPNTIKKFNAFQGGVNYVEPTDG